MRQMFTGAAWHKMAAGSIIVVDADRPGGWCITAPVRWAAEQLRGRLRQGGICRIVDAG